MGMEDYPGTIIEFEKRFATEEDCKQYLYQQRWLQGTQDIVYTGVNRIALFIKLRKNHTMKSAFIQQYKKWTQKSYNQQGVTIIELIVAMTIFLILGTIIFQFMGSQSQKFTEQGMTAEMQQELRWAMQYISNYLKLAGNGVPLTGEWPVFDSIDGINGEPDFISVLGCYKGVYVETTQNMSSFNSIIEVENNDDIEIWDLAVISDGIYQEIFMITDIEDIGNLRLSHDTFLPWNDNNNLDHIYAQGSTISMVTRYDFFVEIDDDGRLNLMVETQATDAQVLIGDVEDFQIRYKLIDGSWVDEINFINDLSMIEILLMAKSPKPIINYTDPVYGDEYKRVELKAVLSPKFATVQP